MRHKLLPGTAIAVATVVYPFVVYYGISRLGVSTLALLLFSLLLLRVIVLGKYKQREQLVPLIVIGCLCLIAAWIESETLLRYYPVLMNLTFAGLFWISLSSKHTLIEQFASPFVKEINDHARRYMRGLTKVWALLLMLNAMVSFYTACCLSLSQWALYNGAIAYLVFGIFTLFELVYRQHYKRQHQG